MNPQSNIKLAEAFPANVRADALTAFDALPEDPHGGNGFAVRVDDEQLLIPYRVYHNPAQINRLRLSSLQNHLIDCVLTRHGDGRIRETNLARIITLGHVWIPPFVVQLLGEYVVEIIQVIDNNMKSLDANLYGQFLKSNPEFLALTEQRVTSYWNCYYGNQRKDEYPGFRALHFFKGLVAE